MKRNKYIGYAMMAAGLFAATSCSDFSDYNEAPVDQNASGNQTLWENISQNSQLSDFAQLVKKSGFDAELNSPRSLTVWAPVNGSFSVADYQNLPTEDLLTQFVKGHIAEYSYAASGKLDERIHMLNEKSFTFAGDGSYTFDGLSLAQANVPSNNGVMHLLNGAAKFYPNLYEYIGSGEGIDSLRSQFKRYELTQLDQSASVKGPMVDGVQTYIDSVLVTSNQLTNQLNARLSNEDSSYTFIMPTDDAFMKMYNKVRPHYNFITTTTVPDVENYTQATSTTTKSISVNASYMADSLTRRAIVRNLIYSNNDAYNQWLVGKGIFTDSVRSTTRNKFSNPRDLVEKYMVGSPIEMSNGYARIVDSLAFYPWETYCPEIVVDPRSWLGNLFPGTALANRNQTIPDTLIEKVFGPEWKGYSNYRYMWISPGGDRAKPDFFIQLPNVQSTTYNFYVVYLPTAMKEIANDPRPNWLNYQLSYCAANGNVATYNFSKAYADSLRTGGKLPAVPTSVGTATAFTNDPQKTDTVFIGQFTFPVAYSGLGEYYPTIRVTSPISVFNSQQLADYTRDVRIAAIILRPIELEEFYAKNK